MSSVFFLAKSVRIQPDDYPQRWRLAKKLFSHRDYRTALEHLMVLKKEWPTKPNVFRYLAATLYRMNRHEESRVALDQGIQRWPEDIGLREQLAYSYEKSGCRVEAVGIWGSVTELQPDHRKAAKHMKRLLVESG